MWPCTSNTERTVKLSHRTARRLKRTAVCEPTTRWFSFELSSVETWACGCLVSWVPYFFHFYSVKKKVKNLFRRISSVRKISWKWSVHINLLINLRIDEFFDEFVFVPSILWFFTYSTKPVCCGVDLNFWLFRFLKRQLKEKKKEENASTEI